MRRLRSNTQPTSLEYYNSLDEIPLYNWIKCTEGDYLYVRRVVTPESKDKPSDVLKWNEIYDEYINEFGLGKLYDRWLKAAIKKAKLECDFVMTREAFKLTEIELQEAKLKAMLDNKGEGMTIEETLIYLSKWVGYHLSPKKITALEYFNLMKEYGKANKKVGNK